MGNLALVIAVCGVAFLLGVYLPDYKRRKHSGQVKVFALQPGRKRHAHRRRRKTGKGKRY